MSHDQYGDLSPVKRALLEMRAMRARLEELERSRSEPVAIVGVGLRLPGGISTPDAYWKLLIEGIDAISEVPASRWDADSYHDPDPDAAGKIVTRFGGYLDRIDEFDAAFFGIAPREAVSMDPQQRLLLEVAWEAFERAGQAPDRLAGSNTGVFIGLSTTDYLTTELKFLDAEEIDPYLVTGGHPSVVSGRLSYALGLQGPSMTIDTACSSSLTAVHLAVQSIRLGECAVALAGGINMLLLPELSVTLSRARMLAPDGRCKTFDARANGFVRSEGCALVVLKRLSDALSDRDRIMAVIRGTAVNQDGRSSGLTVPNGPAQETVIREALRRAAVTPDQVDYVEAHGTGTELGDPVELRALGGVFAAGRAGGRRLRVGSVKTNIGHLEAAAGVTGLIKVALALERGVIPPHLHLKTPTPHVDWDALALEVPVTAATWARDAHPRVAGVSSFGFSGTNAHAILSEAPAAGAAVPISPRPAHILALSAKTDEALRAAAARWSAFIAEHPARLGDISHTMNAGRAHLPHRAAIVASSAAGAREALDALAAGAAPGVARGSEYGARRPEVALLFSGQGYEHAGMGRELFDSQPVFRRTLERCDEILRPHLEASVPSLLYGADQARLHEPRYTQPVLFAFGFALAEMWRSWGVEPSFVAGHSLGEDIAACVAGVFTLEQGLQMVAARARIMHAHLPEGAMAAVFAPAGDVEKMLERAAIQASIAAVNGREHVVMAGSPDAIGAAVSACERAGLKVRPVPVSRACHSPAMDAVLGEIEGLAAAMTLSPPRLAFASTLTGRLAGAAELTDPTYWRRHAREAVRFGDALQSLHDAGARIFVEIGPNGSLSSMGRRMFDGGDVTWLPSLKRDGRDWEHVLTTVRELYVRGVSINWHEVDAGFGFAKVDGPTYPFQRQRYWSDAVRPRHAAPSRPTDAGVWQTSNAYSVVWKGSGAPPAAGSPGLGTVSPLAGVAEAVDAHVPAAARAFDVVEYGRTMAALEQLSTDYMLDALAKLGWSPIVGEVIEPAALSTRLGVRPAQQPLLARVLSYLADDGMLARSGSAYRVACELPPATMLNAHREALRQAATVASELTLVTRCGERLADVLRGDASGVEVVFPRAEFSAAESVYTRSASARFYNGLVQRTVEALIARLPVDRLIRVLEVGAGTGATTASVLPVLPAGRARYVFTDISPAFLHRAQEKFAPFGFVEYHTFDVERPGTSQGFNKGAFDLVIAANVLHATRDLKATVANVRELVADEGVVLFVETTQPRRWLDITFGLTDGWWLFQDRGRRAEQPLISRGAWLTLLEEAGFDSARALPAAADGDVLASMSVLVARATPDSSTRAAAPETWMVLADEGGFGLAVAGALRARGARCIEVRAGAPGGDDDTDRCSIDPRQRDGFVQLFARWRDAGVRGVIDCWPLDAPALDGATADALEASYIRTAGSVLHVTQALAALPSPPPLWVITRDAWSVVDGDTAQGAAQSLAWGVGRVAALEHPELWGGLIDIDAGDPVGMAERVVNAIESGDGEDQIALRRDGRYVARLAPAAPMQKSALPIRRDATYLITGGMGGVGLRIGKEMSRRGAGHLVMMSRAAQPVTAEQQAAIRDIEAKGTRVTLWRGDVTVAADLDRLRAELPSWPALRGVVHAAAFIHSRRLTDLQWDQVLTMLRPKVGGTWLLDQATRDAELDFFVMLSSTAGVFGAQSLAHYAAANVFLDAFAHARRKQGGPATSVSWGTWEVIRGSLETQQEIDRGGLKIMPFEVTLDAFVQLLHPPAPHVVFAHVDWQTLKPLYEARRRRPFFADVGNAPKKIVAVAAAGAAELHAALDAARPVERRPLLQAQVRAAAAAVLGLQPAQVDPKKGLFDLGMDSLMSVDLKNRLETTIGHTLPSTLTFNYPTVAAITEFVAGEVLGLDADDHEVATEAAGATLTVAAAALDGEDELSEDDLSEDELVSLLAARLKAIAS